MAHIANKLAARPVRMLFDERPLLEKTGEDAAPARQLRALGPRPRRRCP